MVATRSDPVAVGTDVLLEDVPEGEMDHAKPFFLRYNGDRSLDSTKYGDVLSKCARLAPGRIHVKGLVVAENGFSCSLTTSGSSTPASVEP